MSTIALVSIKDTRFFDYQDCETFCDAILGHLFQQFDGRWAPLQFYLKAYT